MYFKKSNFPYSIEVKRMTEKYVCTVEKPRFESERGKLIKAIQFLKRLNIYFKWLLASNQGGNEFSLAIIVEYSFFFVFSSLLPLHLSTCSPQLYWLTSVNYFVYLIYLFTYTLVEDLFLCLRSWQVFLFFFPRERNTYWIVYCIQPLEKWSKGETEWISVEDV